MSKKSKKHKSVYYYFERIMYACLVVDATIVFFLGFYLRSHSRNMDMDILVALVTIPLLIFVSILGLASSIITIKVQKRNKKRNYYLALACCGVFLAPVAFSIIFQIIGVVVSIPMYVNGG